MNARRFVTIAALLAPAPERTPPDLGVCLVAVVPDYAAGCEQTPPDGFEDDIVGAANEFGIDPWMVAVTVHRESGCDPYALGSSGEIGLAQVNPSVWMRALRREGIAHRPQELYDVRTNLRAAAFVLRRATDASDGDLFDTFRRYNGSGAKARQYARDQVAAYAAVVP